VKSVDINIELEEHFDSEVRHFASTRKEHLFHAYILLFSVYIVNCLGKKYYSDYSLARFGWSERSTETGLVGHVVL